MILTRIVGLSEDEMFHFTVIIYLLLPVNEPIFLRPPGVSDSHQQ